jgi:type I restriction enzyme S subunit
MEIQLEIVQVLDSFVELEKSIENELRARKKQFEFYSRKALAFVGKAQDGIRGVNFAPLSSLARRNAGTSITARQMKSLATRNGDIKVFAAGSTTAVVSAGAIPHKDVYVGPSVVVKSRGYIGSEFVDSPFSHKSELWSYTFSQEVEAKFVNYWLQTKIDFLQKLARSKSVKLPQLAVADTDTLLVPQPPIGVQTEIVASLDSFRTLISQLEAELELRQLQSMYYRDKLLSFRES